MGAAVGGAESVMGAGTGGALRWPGFGRGAEKLARRREQGDASIEQRKEAPPCDDRMPLGGF